MKEIVEQILYREEETYYKLLNVALDLSIKKDLPEENKRRLNDELEIIHIRLLSKTIWFLLLITLKAKKDDEPYFVRSTITDLYLLYVLGIIKSNPIETRCCYQACLGTKKLPKRGISFDISFRNEYVDKIKEYVKTIDEKAKCYHYTYHYEDYQLNKSSMIIIPDGIDVFECFNVAKINGAEMKVVGEKEYSFDIGVKFNLLHSNMLSILKEMIDMYGNTSIEETFEDYKFVLKNKKFSSKYELKLLKYYKINSFNDAINFDCISHSMHKKEEIDSFFFSDRESVFYYFLNEVGLSEEKSFLLMEDVRKGRYSKKYSDSDLLAEKVNEKVINDLNNILYLFPRGHSAEYLYSKIMLAHYFRYHEKEYLKLKAKYKE